MLCRWRIDAATRFAPPMMLLRVDERYCYVYGAPLPPCYAARPLRHTPHYTCHVFSADIIFRCFSCFADYFDYAGYAMPLRTLCLFSCYDALLIACLSEERRFKYVNTCASNSHIADHVIQRLSRCYTTWYTHNITL